jgi:O-antigen/teichoic acid export membrane protein
MLSNAVWLAGGRMAGDVAGFVLVIVLSRTFGPEGIGNYAYGFAIASLIYAFVNLTMEDYAIRECARLDAAGRAELLGGLLGAQLPLAALFSALTVGYVWLVDRDSPAGPIVLLLTGYQVAFALSKSFFVPAVARQHMLVPAVTELTCRLLAIGSTTTLVLAGNAPLTLALVPFPAAGLVLCVVATVSARRHNGRLYVRFGWRRTVTLIGILWPFAASTIVYNVYSRADLIMLAWMRGEIAAGLYAPSLKFLEVGSTPLYLLGIAAYPALSLMFGRDRAGFGGTAVLFTRAGLVLGGLLAWAMAYVVPAVLVLTLGEEFRDAIPVVRLMSLLAMVTATELILVRLLLASHLQVARVRLQTWAMLLNVSLNLAVIPWLGVMGAVGASILSQGVLAWLYFRTLRTVEIAGLGRSLGLFVGIFGVAAALGEGLDLAGVGPELGAGAALALFLAALAGTRYLPLGQLRRSWRAS